MPFQSVTMTYDATQPWHLGMINSVTLPAANAVVNYNYEGTASGVDIIIVDEGAETHTDFAGRLFDIDSPTNGTFSHPYGASLSHDSGENHGLGCLGVAGGTTTGAAKAVRLYMLRAIDYDEQSASYGSIFQDAMAAVGVFHRSKAGSRPTILSFSIGTGASDIQYWSAPVQKLINMGVIVLTSAHNQSNTDARVGQAAGLVLVPGIITVSGHDQHGAVFGCTGTKVDIVGPMSPVYKSTTAGDGYSGFGGTSGATPTTAGVIARLVSLHPTYKNKDVITWLQENAQRGQLNNNILDTPNLRLYAPGTIT